MPCPNYRLDREGIRCKAYGLIRNPDPDKVRECTENYCACLEGARREDLVGAQNEVFQTERIDETRRLEGGLQKLLALLQSA